MVYLMGYRYKEPSQAFWWKHLGGVLATLLDQAGYSDEARYRHLNFFAQCVVPSLGPRLRLADIMTDQRPSEARSYMTDDGMPIELSWDWGSKTDARPIIRYSVELVGLRLMEGKAGEELQKDLIRYVRGGQNGSVDFSSFNKLCQDFAALYQTRRGAPHSEDPNRVFYAVDLDGESAMAKGYICLKPGSCGDGSSILDMVGETLVRATPSRAPNLTALRIFQDWVRDQPGDVEIPVLSLDLVDSPKSRSKIYYRTRETSFESLVSCLTLDGRLTATVPAAGLDRLRRLWDAVLDTAGGSSEGRLKKVDNETAGILYNVAFSTQGGGAETMVTKVYIPVRHYAESDAAALDGLRRFLQEEGRGAHVGAFDEAVESLFDVDALETGRGVQTYLGAQVNWDGSLRVVSYINPQIHKLL